LSNDEISVENYSYCKHSSNDDIENINQNYAVTDNKINVWMFYVFWLI